MVQCFFCLSSNSVIKLTYELFDLISDKIRFKNMDILMSQLSLEDICLFFLP